MCVHVDTSSLKVTIAIFFLLDRIHILSVGPGILLGAPTASIVGHMTVNFFAIEQTTDKKIVNNKVL